MEPAPHAEACRNLLLLSRINRLLLPKHKHHRLFHAARIKSKRNHKAKRKTKLHPLASEENRFGVVRKTRNLSIVYLEINLEKAHIRSFYVEKYTAVDKRYRLLFAGRSRRRAAEKRALCYSKYFRFRTLSAIACYNSRPSVRAFGKEHSSVRYQINQSINYQ